MKIIKNLFSTLLLFSIILLTFVGCRLSNPKRYDLHYAGMDMYYNYDKYVPQDSIPNNLLPSGDEFLTDYPYSYAEYHYYKKNLDESRFLDAYDYDVGIMILTYDEAMYMDAKEALFEEYSDVYCGCVPFFSHNGYEFNELYRELWGSNPKAKLIFHIFNDSKKTIILLNWKSWEEPKRFSTFEESGDVMGFFEYFYGDFYDFNS